MGVLKMPLSPNHPSIHPWELSFADDFVVIVETEDDLIKRLIEWKDNVENRGMRVNMNKGYDKWKTLEANAESCKMAIWCLVEVLMVIQFSVLVRKWVHKKSRGVV